MARTFEGRVGGRAGGMTGAAPGSYNSASGGIPGVTSPIDTVTGNIGGLSGIIGSLTGASSTALRTQYPDEYFTTLGTLLGNTQRRAAGDISDLLPELQQTSAEDAVYGGMSGSGAENTKLLRDLGLTRYGVQNQAIDALSKIQGQIPTVRPFDPSGIIASQLAAQERADLYASAPVPEDAFQRALAAAEAAAFDNEGWNRRGGTPLMRGGGGGGGRAGAADPGWGGFAPPTVQYGTASNPFGTSQEFAPWGSFPGAISGSGGDGLQSEDEWLSELFGEKDEQDFGGSLNFNGGNPWGGFNTDIFGGIGGADMSGEWLTTDIDPGSGNYFE